MLAGRAQAEMRRIEIGSHEVLENYPSVRLSLNMAKESAASKAARALAKRSVRARKQAWGEEEFIRRMQDWGKLGGRPKGNGKKKAR
jgi:hypothetical protein